MCLTKYLDSNITKYNLPLFKIAEDDIIVLKMLRQGRPFVTNSYKTPWQNDIINFRKGVALQSALEICGSFCEDKEGILTIYDIVYENGSVKPLFLRTIFCIEKYETDRGGSCLLISKGIHSYNTKAVPPITSFSLDKLFKAVIPKGARYMKGDDNTYVSDELLIFQNEEAYENYKKSQIK